MSDFKNITFSTASRIAHQVISVLIIFFITPLMIGVLGDYRYGIWVLANVIVSYYGYAEIGISQALKRELSVAIGAKNTEQFNRIFSNGLFLNFIIFFLVAALALISFWFINIYQVKDYGMVSKLILLLGFSLAISFPFKTFINILEANIKFELISLALIIQAVLQAILTAILLLSGYGLIELGVATLCTKLIADILILYFSKKIYPETKFNKNLINMATIKSLLGYSGKTFALQIANVLRYKIDEILIGIMISVSAVTGYSVANKLIQRGFAVNFSFLGTLTPLFSKYYSDNNNENKLKMFFTSSKIVITTSAFLLFCALFLGKPFINTWLGAEYEFIYFPLVILAVAYYLEFMQSISVEFMFSTNTHQYLAVMMWLEGLGNLILSLILVFYFKLGIIGIAFGTLIPTAIIKLIFHPVIASRILKIKSFEYYRFFIKNNIPGFILYSICGALISLTTLDNYLKLGVALLVFCAVALIHLILMLNQEEKSFAAQKFKLPLSV